MEAGLRVINILGDSVLQSSSSVQLFVPSLLLLLLKSFCLFLLIEVQLVLRCSFSFFLFDLLVDLASLHSLPLLIRILLPLRLQSPQCIFEPEIGIIVILLHFLFEFEPLEAILLFFDLGLFEGMPLIFDGFCFLPL